MKKEVSGMLWTCDAPQCPQNEFLPEDTDISVKGYYGVVTKEQEDLAFGGDWYACSGSHILAAIQEVIRRSREDD